MKRYSDLTSLQKDFAVDSALEILVQKLIETDFDYQFKSPLAQKHFLGAFQDSNHNMQIKSCIMRSDEIAEELYPIAESMAETAYYPNGDDYVLEGISK